jgi:predicted enzyme related to lactoylglutathione lyase
MPRLVHFEIAVDNTAIPGIGYYAACKDSEGNTFGSMQDDPTAK